MRPALDRLEERALLAGVYQADDVASLIRAIDQFNAATEVAPTTINLAPGRTYTLDSPAYGQDGLPPIQGGTGLLTIKGNGATIVRNAASTAKFRILEVDTGAQLRIDDLTIAGGSLLQTSNNYGGAGLAVLGGTVALNNVRLRDHVVATNRPEVVASGGAVEIYGGSLTIDGGSIENSTAKGYEGSIGVDGGAAYGGAIHVFGGNLVMKGASIHENTAQGGMGGAGANGTSGSPDSRAGASGGNGFGGAIYFDGRGQTGTLEVVGSDFDVNNAVGGRGGPGGTAYGSGRGANGGAGGDASGGAMYLSSAVADATNTAFYGNTAAGGNRGQLGRLSNGDWSMYLLAYTSDGYSPIGSAVGGAVATYNSKLNLTGDTLAANFALSVAMTFHSLGEYDAQSQIFKRGYSLTPDDFTLIGYGSTARASGGGIYVSASEVSILGSTIANNQAAAIMSRRYFEIRADGSLIFSYYLWNQTPAAPSGGGVEAVSGTVRIGNSLIAGNRVRMDDDSPDLTASADVSGTVVSSGSNLIGSKGINSSIFKTTDKVGTTSQPIDPKLSKLGFNGGRSLGYDLMPGSPAIDAGDDALATEATDGRGAGFGRKFNGRVDIGAIESQTPTIAVVDGDRRRGTVSGVYPGFTVRLTSAGSPQAGRTVVFQTPESGASALFANGTHTVRATTDADGYASTGPLTANEVVGKFDVAVSKADAASVAVALENMPAVVVDGVAASGIHGGVGSFNARVVYQSLPLSGQAVSFYLRGVYVGTKSTGADGWALLDGVPLGAIEAGVYPNDVSASYPGADFHAGASASGVLGVGAHGDFAALAFAGASSQTTPTNASFGSTLKIKTLDAYGNAVPNVSVTFAAPSRGPGGVFDNGLATITTTSDQAGVAAVGFKANGLAGLYDVSADAGGLHASFRLNNLSVTRIDAVGGVGLRNDSETLTARLTDANGPIVGKPIRFYTSPGSRMVGDATTDANGVATLTFAVGDVLAGKFVDGVVAAYAGDLSHSVATAKGDLAVAANGPAANIVVVGGSSAEVAVQENVADGFRAKVTDAYGNPVPNVRVRFDASAGSGSFATGGTTALVLTGPDGLAAAPPFRASSIVGAYTLDASWSPDGVYTKAPAPGRRSSVNFQVVPSALQSLIVNGGSANRSNIQTLTLVFNGSSELQNIVDSVGSPTPRLKLVYRGVDGSLNKTIPLSRQRVSKGDRTIQLDFSASGWGSDDGRLSADGYYQVIVASSATDRVDSRTFHRLLGDLDGDGAVTNNDVQAVSAALGLFRPDVGYDVDGDGFVNLNDLLVVKRQLGRRLSGALRLDA